MRQGEILTLPAGRELDALVAQRVLGHVVTHLEDIDRTVGGITAPAWELRPYSRDFDAAWNIHRCCRRAPNGRRYARALRAAIVARIGKGIPRHEVVLHFEPVDICRAALLMKAEVER